MENTISVFFGNDRTYISAVKPTQNGIALEFLDSTSAPLNFTEDDEAFRNTTHELQQLLKNESASGSKISVVFPISGVFVHQFPAMNDVLPEELRKLVEFEIRQQLPDYAFSDFKTTVYPMAAQPDGTEMMLAVSIEKKNITRAEEIFKELDIPIERIDASQLAAHSALAYNYPEHNSDTIMLIDVQEQFIDISVVKEGKLAYCNSAPMLAKEQIGEICEREMQNLLAEYVPSVDAIFLFGSGLTKQMLSIVQQQIPIDVERLNSFRMMRSELGERERQYATRAAHIFPACIGGALPSFQEGIEIM